MKAILLTLLLVPSMAVAQYSDEWMQTEADINAYLQQNAQHTQSVISGLESKVSAGIRRASQSNNSQSSGMRISVDAQRKAQRDADHRAWLEQRQEEIREQQRRQAERERLRQEEERRRREAQYQAVYATEYIRAGARADRLTQEARWRTGEGAELMDRMHDEKRLMTASTEKNFSSSASPRGHRMRPLTRRLQHGLSPDAIPRTAMTADARPWSEWSQYVPPMRIAPPPVTRVKSPQSVLDSDGQWAELESRLGRERAEQIRYAAFDACGGRMPDLRYDSGDGRYVMFNPESHKIITIDPDGKSMTIHQLTEKDDSIWALWRNIKESASLSLDFNAIGGKISSRTSITPGSDKEVASNELTIGGMGARVSDKGYQAKAGNLSVGQDFGKDGVKADVTFGDKRESTALLDGSISTKIKLYENSSEIKHSILYFADNASTPSIGMGYNVGFGATVKGSAKASMTLDESKGKLSYSREVKGEVSVAKAGTQVQMMYRPPLYKGMCFATLSGEAKVGYEYKYKSGSGKKIEGEKSVNLGKLPLTLSGAGHFRCYSPEDIAK